MKLPWTQLIEHLKQQLVDERELHARELERVLTENKRLQAEVEGLRLERGQPTRMLEEVAPQAPRDPDEMPQFTGTPWDRVRQKEMWLQTPAGRRWQAKQLASLKEFTKPSGETEKGKEN